jgi:uncharacterized protein (DUF58 family)
MPGALTAAGLGIALILAGLGFGTPSLLVPGVGLLGLGAISFIWVELATPRRLVRGDGPTRIVEGEPFELKIEAFGARLPPPTAELSDAVLRKPVELGPTWKGKLETTVWIRGRGRRQLEPARLEIRDPLGLRVRTVTSEDPGGLLVLPRVEPVLVGGSGAGGIRASTIAGIEEGAATRQLDARAIELEVDGLRAYREGTPASRIHWPAVARTGELIERRLISGAESAPLVVLDSSRPASAGALDAAVRAVGSLCVHLAGRGGCAVLLSGHQRAVEVEPDMRAWPGLHARLAIVGPSIAPPVLSRVLRSGTVFWVTAHERPAIPSALRSGGGGAGRFLVAPVEGSPSAAAFTVAGCAGWRIGARSRAVWRAA